MHIKPGHPVNAMMKGHPRSRNTDNIDNPIRLPFEWKVGNPQSKDPLWFFSRLLPPDAPHVAHRSDRPKLTSSCYFPGVDPLLLPPLIRQPPPLKGEVGDAKYDDPGYYNGGRGGYNGGGYNNGGRGGYYNGGRGGYYNGGRGGYYNGGRGGYCRYGCCGGGRYYGSRCRCCSTLAESTAYKQAHDAQTHN
ncbi:hypothetical protein R6Q59_019184 [Mikania micrantha]